MASPLPLTRRPDIDPKVLWQRVLNAARRARRWSLIGWLAPDVPVRVLRADGTEMVWLGEAASAAEAGVRKHGAFVAFELPEDIVLRRRMRVPAVREIDIADAAELEIRGVSPFEPGDLAWGFCRRRSDSATIEVEMALASRKQISVYLGEAAQRLGKLGPPEIWVVSAQGAPIVFRGYGESRRTTNAMAWRRAGYAFVLINMLLVGAIVLTPAAQLRQRTIEAATAFQMLQSQSSPLLQQREKFLKSTEQLRTLATLLADTIDPLAAMDLLTRALPDDTFLTGLQVQGLKMTISGQTTNAAALMQHLSAQDGLREVKAPGASMRPAGSAKEAFVIEFAVDAKVFARAPVLATLSPALAMTPAATNAMPAAPPASSLAPSSSNTNSQAPRATAVSPTLPVIGAVAPSTAQVSPAAPIANGGGGAVFGGTPAPRPAPKAEGLAQ